MGQSEPRRTTLLVVMVVITLGLIISGTAGIWWWYSRQFAIRSWCGKNQSQIIGGLVAFSINEEINGWIPTTFNVESLSSGAKRARVVTTKVLENMAASQSFPNNIFKCYASRSFAPTTRPKLNDGASSWGLQPGHFIGYALDWAAPSDPTANRILIADRDAAAHRGTIMAGFGDAHVKSIKLISPPTRAVESLVTEDTSGKPTSGSTGTLSDDDIFSNEGDGGDSLTPGKGDPLRAWVK